MIYNPKTGEFYDDPTVEQILATKIAIKQMELSIKEAKDRIKKVEYHLKEDNYTYAGWKLTRKSISKKQLDTKRLREEDPDMYDMYLKRISYEYFDIKKEE